MSMTIYQLKQELLSHGIGLPEASARKEVYEKLYQDYVVKPQKSKTPRKSTPARNDFSSDDEAVANSGNGVPYDDVEVEYFDPVIAEQVESLSNEEIYVALTNLGQNIGPVVATTREMYKKRLIKVWSQNGHFAESGLGNGSGENGLHLNGHSDETAEVQISQQFSSDDEEVEILDEVAASSETLPIDKKSVKLTKEEKKKLDALMTPRYYSSTATASSKSPAASTSDGEELKAKKKKSQKNVGGEGAEASWTWICFGIVTLLLAAYLAYEYYTEPDVKQPWGETIQR